MQIASFVIACFVIACFAFVVAAFALGWQIYIWRHARRFDVRVNIEEEPIPFGENRYEITVVVRNLGATEEAVESVALLCSRYGPEIEEDRIVLGPPTLVDRNSDALPPRRNVRRSYNLLGFRFIDSSG